jgi:hypothetical protein
LNTDTVMLGESCWSHHVWASPRNDIPGQM